MIIKFDHISYIESRKNKKNILQFVDQKGYKYRFKEDMLVNLPMKKVLMEKAQETHDIYYFEHGVEMPLELIFYSYVGNSSRIERDGNSIYVSGRDAPQIMNCLHEMGFRFLHWDKEKGFVRCNIKGILNQQDYWLVIDLNKERNEVFLDQQGYGCITFIVNSFKNIYRCVHTGDYLSMADDICVNNQMLKIVFYRSIKMDIYFEFCIPLGFETDMKRGDIE